MVAPAKDDLIRINNSQFTMVQEIVENTNPGWWLVKDDGGSERIITQWKSDLNEDTRNTFRDANTIKFQFRFDHNQVGMTVDVRYAVDNKEFNEWQMLDLFKYQGSTLDTRKEEQRFLNNMPKGMVYEVVKHPNN